MIDYHIKYIFKIIFFLSLNHWLKHYILNNVLVTKIIQ